MAKKKQNKKVLITPFCVVAPTEVLLQSTKGNTSKYNEVNLEMKTSYGISHKINHHH